MPHRVAVLVDSQHLPPKGKPYQAISPGATYYAAFSLGFSESPFQLSSMKFATTFTAIILAAMAYGVQAAPRPAEITNDMVDLVARGCSCRKVGNEWVCGGSTCP
ncbi:hypothetical protein D9613_009091 [Agrocybe pediades]|uniref:Uncharacterized protein n=1 Tax=Agrocybe pediades TaxID=84607 RepID=A0A8H4VTF9_9AGAR|nr:hypothetical protein D9613_009091 [Agrocybe pediades]